MMMKNLVAVLFLPIALCAFAEPYAVSANGLEVTDTKTSLIWRRCAEGMALTNGVCSGIANSFTHEGALTHARMQSASSGIGWRLPNVKELSSIVDRNRLDPAIDIATFSATPNSWFWSSTPYTSDSFSAWYIDFRDGTASYNLRQYLFNVRLVRASQ